LEQFFDLDRSNVAMTRPTIRSRNYRCVELGFARLETRIRRKRVDRGLLGRSTVTVAYSVLVLGCCVKNPPWAVLFRITATVTYSLGY